MKLFSRVLGTGQPLVILHGLFGMGDNWLTIGRKLSAHYQIHLLDLRNHGRSPHSDIFNYQVLVEDLWEYLRERALFNPILLGHSLGGKIAMQMALTHPAKVAKLIVVDIAPRSYQRPFFPRVIQALQAIPLSSLSSRQEADQHLSRNIPQKHIRQFLLKNLARSDHNQFYWKLNLSAIAKNLSQLLEDITSSQPYPGPTLFIKGELSDYIEPQDEARIKNLFPNSIIKTIPQASHWLHAEKPQLFLQIVNTFLQTT